MVLFPMTLSDLERLSEIFSDMEHRVVSATAELVGIVGKTTDWLQTCSRF